MNNNIFLFHKPQRSFFIFLFSFILCALVTIPALAKDSIVVENGYVRATIPGTQVSAAYMDLLNKSDKNKTLIGVEGAISERIEIHEHVMADGMMKMRQRENLVIEANNRTVLQPSGYHLMIFNLTSPLKPGQTVHITLLFSDGSKQHVPLPVQSIKRKKNSNHAHHH